MRTKRNYWGWDLLKRKSIENRELEFYKNFYDENKIALMQYKSLRKHFHKMVEDVLGKGYYNMGMDVYECDRLCCEDITNKSKGWFKKLFRR